MEENKQHKTALPETEPIPSAQAPEALLDIRGLRVEYHTDEDVVYAVNGLDLTIGKGEFVAVVGQSGCGKSTMMNVLGCLDIPTRGTYLLGGTDVRELTDKELSHIRNKQIGFIFQQ